MAQSLRTILLNCSTTPFESIGQISESRVLGDLIVVWECARLGIPNDCACIFRGI